VRAARVLAIVAALGGAALAPAAHATDAATIAARHGTPSAVWFDADGREVWDYDGNPFRFSGLRFRFDTDGVLVREEDPRSEAVVASIASGMTAREVRDRLGEPPAMFFVRDEPHWEWRVLWAGRRPHRLVVQFDRQGIVKAVARQAIDAGAGRGTR
jgi:hypothetical protein